MFLSGRMPGIKPPFYKGTKGRCVSPELQPAYGTFMPLRLAVLSSRLIVLCCDWVDDLTWIPPKVPEAIHWVLVPLTTNLQVSNVPAATVTLSRPRYCTVWVTDVVFVFVPCGPVAV